MKGTLFLIVTLLMLIIFPAALNAQDERDVRDMRTYERIYVGGTLGLQLGTTTTINISPMVGYRITNRLSAGVGGTYQYYADRTFGSFSQNVYGGSTFARFLVIPQVFLHAEYERVSLETLRFGTTGETERVWEDNYFLGAGYRLRIGEKSFFNIILLYNFNQESEVYYQNPQFRFGVDFGL